MNLDTRSKFQPIGRGRTNPSISEPFLEVRYVSVSYFPLSHIATPRIFKGAVTAFITGGWD
jgi:hypothetical protein